MSIEQFFMENLQTMGRLFWAAAMVGGAVLVFIWVWRRVWPHLKRLFATAEAAPEESIAPVQQASRELEELSQVLSGLDGLQSDQALRHITDARIMTGHIVAAAVRVAKKAEEYGERSRVLDRALESLATRDRLQMARAAGEITWDLELQAALLADVDFGNEPFWMGIYKLMGSQLGGFASWGRAYQDYSAALLARVAGEKAKVQRLMALDDFIHSSRQLVLIQQDLEQASQHLRITTPIVRRRIEAALPTRLMLE